MSDNNGLAAVSGRTLVASAFNGAEQIFFVSPPPSETSSLAGRLLIESVTR